MKHLLVSLVFTLMISVVYSQTYPQLSQYMNNKTAFNPAFAGSSEEICLSGTHRQQWVGFPGRPITSFFSASAPLSPFGISSGVGLSIMNDQVGSGLESNLSIAADIAVYFELGQGKLGVGVNAGILNRTFDPSELYVPDGVYYSENDPLKPQEKDSRVAFNMNMGLSYTTDNLYFGISATNLTQSEIQYVTAEQPHYLVRHYFVMAGYRFQLSNPLFEIMPSVFLKSDGVANQAELSGLLRYNKKIWGGVSYRTGDAVIGIFGLELFNGLRVTYSYDFTTTQIANHSGGSHEFWIGYCFSLSTERAPQKYKSIRFL